MTGTGLDCGQGWPVRLGKLFLQRQQDFQWVFIRQERWEVYHHICFWDGRQATSQRFRVERGHCTLEYAQHGSLSCPSKTKNTSLTVTWQTHFVLECRLAVFLCPYGKCRSEENKAGIKKKVWVSLIFFFLCVPSLGSTEMLQNNGYVHCCVFSLCLGKLSKTKKEDEILQCMEINKCFLPPLFLYSFSRCKNSDSAWLWFEQKKRSWWRPSVSHGLISQHLKVLTGVEPHIRK